MREEQREGEKEGGGTESCRCFMSPNHRAGENTGRILTLIVNLDIKGFSLSPTLR